MKKMILFAVSFFAANQVWAQQSSTAAPASSVEAANADNVPVEEYVPKVIIEGKWGAGPGEFGYDGFYLEGFVPKSASFTPDDFIYPRSLAVDSRGNIYVLDIANNRIQKFNAAGKYLSELKIDSWSGYVNSQNEDIGYVYTIKGINIAVDSKDNLYYYLKRAEDGKETGEVWEFKEDKLVRKNKKNAKDIDDPQNPKAIPYSQHPARNWIQADIKQEANENFTAVEKEGKRTLKIKLQGGKKISGYAIYDKKEKMWKIGVKSGKKLWRYIYDEMGNLSKISEVPRLSEFSDSNGNYYYLEIKETGIVLKKSELVKVK